jgi:hypothetical protein
MQRMTEDPSTCGARSFFAGVLIALLGILVGQAILYGPSLAGKKVLLPLRILASPGSYLPSTDESPNLIPHSMTLADLVFFIEPERQFAIAEIAAGRLPLWTPHRFAGAPLYTLGLSPPWLIAYLIRSPIVLAWTQLLIAMIAGLGMYYFCRRVLGLGLWPAVIAAWCYPLTGAYILWIGQWLPAVMCWLPWVLSAVDRIVRIPWGWGAPALCALTVLVIVGGAVDVAGQVLLASGIYGIWRILDEYGRGVLRANALRAIAALGLAWTLGFACAAWLLLPLRDYLNNGTRVMARRDGGEERPPAGLTAAPQVVFPDIYGSFQRGSYRTSQLPLPESPATAYTGSMACLVLAPLAWFGGRRSMVALLGFLALFSLGWSFNFPPIVSLLRLPGFNMMSHNRMAFVAGFALMALAAFGLEVLLRRRAVRGRWFWVPAGILTALCVWCVYRAFVLPEPIATQLAALVANGPIRDINEPWEVAAIQQSFRTAYVVTAVFSALGAAAWAMLLKGSTIRLWFPAAVTGLLFVELLHFGYGYAEQTEPALYFPTLPILDRITDGPPGRIIGFGCLPANLAQIAGLDDVRGYDGIDPSRIVQLLTAARNPKSPVLSYAATQLMSPLIFSDSQTGEPRVSAILDMLNVRYVVFRGTPPAGVRAHYSDPDYWVYLNENALPRAFVPQQTQLIADADARLEAMSANDFDPRRIAYMEQSVDLPRESHGSVDVVEDSPQRVVLSANMQTEGLVVLADRFDRGWKAYVNETEVSIWRVNHALRGVRVGPGESTIRFVYKPESLRRGFAISGVAGITWLAWMIGLVGFRCPDSFSPIAEPATKPVSEPLQPPPPSSPRNKSKRRRLTRNRR